MTRWRNRWLRFWRAARVLAAVALAACLALLLPWPRPLAALLVPPATVWAPIQDPVVLARDGRTLRHGVGRDGSRGTWTPLAAHPGRLILAFLAAEDARFFAHHGVDFEAILRALGTDLAARRIVSGASTITQQTVRRLIPAPRTFRTKIREAIEAVALEKLFTKDEILEQYLNRLPMPWNLRGAAAGAAMLLGRDLADLSLGECAFLAALPKAPARLGRHRVSGAIPSRIEWRRRWILRRMETLGYISAQERMAATGEAITLRPQVYPFLAPHLADRVLASRGGPGAATTGPLGTTIDADLQERVEKIVASHRARLARRGAHQVACIVADNATSEVRAYVGSAAYGPVRNGFCDGARAPHSAGSTLKPFAYALALEHGMTLTEPVPDVRRVFRTPRGDYDPRNFDRRDNGPVSLRTALGSSLNEAAIEVARRVGAPAIADLLAQSGLIRNRKAAVDLGIGIVIGNVEVRLTDLAAAYAALARGGTYRPLAFAPPAPGATPVEWRVIEPDTDFLILDTLSDPTARTLTFGNPLELDYPFPVALKTGTSTGYRDSWAVGVTSKETVAVWTGNFNGAPTAGLAGATAAAPILRDIILAIHPVMPPPAFVRPAGIVEHDVCSDSGGLPSAGCPLTTRGIFLARLPLPGPCREHGTDRDASTHLDPIYASWLADRSRRGLAGRYRIAGAATAAPALGGAGASAIEGVGLEIVAPLPGDRFILSRTADPTATAALGHRAPASQDVTVRAQARRLVPYVRWFVDGAEQARTPPPYGWRWRLERGRHHILATTPDLTAATMVEVTVE